MTCKDCKWFDPGIPTRPKGFCHYGICARDGEDVGSKTPACDPWFEMRAPETVVPIEKDK